MTLYLTVRGGPCLICGARCDIVIVSMEKPSQEAISSMTAKKLEMRGWTKLRDCGRWICNKPDCKDFIRRARGDL